MLKYNYMNKNIIIGVVAVIVIVVGYYVITRDSEVEELTIPVSTETNQMPVNSGENAAPGSAVHDLPVEPAAAVVRTDLSKKLAVEEKSIVIMLVEDKEWSDGCLGLGGPAESCLMALVPGFRIELQTKGQTYVYRTDKTGSSVRMETNPQ